METFLLINPNTIIGGGETLLVRFAEYLSDRHKVYVLCGKGYIESQLKNSDNIVVLNYPFNVDYYYLSEQNRRDFSCRVSNEIAYKDRVIRVVSFTLNALYIAYSLSNYLKRVSISHLVLHTQDYLYASQSIKDKVYYSIFKMRKFSRYEQIKYNINLLKQIEDCQGLISMSEPISSKWRKETGLKMEKVIPLPIVGDVVKQEKNIYVFNKKILWIGRLVDFKIPALKAMIDFIASNNDYCLSIIGSGKNSLLMRYVKKKGITDRVNFLGTLQPESLKEIIMNHSIGYAMGTSIIEIAQYRKPVITALANYKHTDFKRRICGGIFSDLEYGDVGDSLNCMSEEEISNTINNTISKIEKNYNQYADLCFEKAVNDFSLLRNFDSYEKIILETKELHNYIEIPKANFLRISLLKLCIFLSKK